MDISRHSAIRRPKDVESTIARSWQLLEHRENGGTIETDCDPRVDTLGNCEVMPCPAPSSIERRERRATGLEFPARLTRIPLLADEEHAGNELISVSRVGGKKGLHRAEPGRSDIHRSVSADRDESFCGGPSLRVLGEDRRNGCKN